MSYEQGCIDEDVRLQHVCTSVVQVVCCGCLWEMLCL